MRERTLRSGIQQQEALTERRIQQGLGVWEVRLGLVKLGEVMLG